MSLGCCPVSLVLPRVPMPYLLLCSLPSPQPFCGWVFDPYGPRVHSPLASLRGFLPGRCHFSTFKQCQEWLSRLSRATARPAKPEDLFAFAYHAWCLGLTEEDQHTHLCQPGEARLLSLGDFFLSLASHPSWTLDPVLLDADRLGGCVAGEHIRCRQEAELARMGFDLQNVWRVSHINSNYK